MEWFVLFCYIVGCGSLSWSGVGVFIFYFILEVRKIYKLKVGVVIFFEVWLNLDSRDHLRWYIE